VERFETEGKDAAQFVERDAPVETALDGGESAAT